MMECSCFFIIDFYFNGFGVSVNSKMKSAETLEQSGDGSMIESENP